jgi:predicted short-subunit dehydrogenase-like oxidoreductase (DUF2520 family)
LVDRVEGCEALDDPQQVADLASIVFITTPDAAIENLAASVRWNEGQWVVHCSGAEPAGILNEAEKYGASIGTFHPFQTFASVDQALEDLPGITFGVEAKGELYTWLEGLAAGLGGKALPVPPDTRSAYHAAAFLACGYMVALADASASLLEVAGFSRLDAFETMAPLMQATVRNVKEQGATQAFTGPLARGDLRTIRLHLEALEQYAPNLLPLYCCLGLAALPLAAQKGNLTPETQGEIGALLQAWTTRDRPLIRK